MNYNLKMNKAMKRVFVLFAFCVVALMQLDAQVYKLKTTSMAFRSYDGYSWSDWSAWDYDRGSNILVVINANSDIITIYSKETQEYDILNLIENEKQDPKGGVYSEWLCVDRNGLRCHFRLRKQRDDTLQLYIDYSDFSFVYNVISR